MTNHTPPLAPDDLGPEASRFWDDVVRDYTLADFQLAILETACHAKHMESECLRILAAEGFTVETGAGMIRARPEATILRDARAAFLRACKDLNLEIDQ